MNSHLPQHSNLPLDEILIMAGAGVWFWEPAARKAIYSAAWAKVLGYSLEELPQSPETRNKMILPADLDGVGEGIEKFLSGEQPIYEGQFRMLHKNGGILWVREKGHITAFDKDGKPLGFMGVIQDITRLKNAELCLEESLAYLKHKHSSFESVVEKHTMEMEEQGKLLWTVNQISKKLLAVQSNENFGSLVNDCLCLLGKSIGKSKVYIWKDFIDEFGNSCCTEIYEWVSDTQSIFVYEGAKKIAYADLPSFQAAVEQDKCLNSLLRNLSDSEQSILWPRGIRTILIAPIAVNGKRWGFIGVDNCEDEKLFTSVEENMLMMSGSMLATAIEKVNTEETLREMEELTLIMLNATPLCCNLWTSEFVNMSCNDEAVRLFELSSQKEYLDRFEELSPEYQPNGQLSNDLAISHIKMAFQEGYCRFEWQHQKLDGTPIPAEISLVRIKYKDGFIVAGYTRDLREQKAMLAALKTREALRMARDEALSNSKAKSNFLANMSHEIRTPMNAISGFADIILRESTDVKTTEYAKNIKDACGSLINIINDILDITKIESGKLDIYNAPYELSHLLSDVISISRMRLGSKPLMFITDIDSRLPARLIGDEIRLKQILLNILSNAIKYTQEGFFWLRVTGAVKDGHAVLFFSVKDSGVGIQAEDLGRLFEEFERVNTKKNRSIEGTGLGLAISKRLCEMMGGSLEVESIFGEGSEFTAIVPQVCPDDQWLCSVEKAKTVLLYEPRERYRLSIAESLENLGCKCVPCTSQSTLYNHISAMPYDYILTAALYLKKVQSTLRKNKISVPVAAFVGYGEKVEDDQVCTIQFPVNCLQLSAMLNGKCEQAHFSRQDQETIRFTAPTARILVVDDNLVNLQVAKGLMEPYGFAIDTAKNGVEAVEKVRQGLYDLVFMDHMMPEMDGVDATEAIRNLAGARYQSLPIIALSANALVGTREMFIREGMNDYLAKPIETDELDQLLLKWLPQSKIIKSASQAPVKKMEEAPEWKISGVDAEKGILSVGGNKTHYLQILSAYHRDAWKKYTALPGHLEKNDFKAFQTEVHALKSTSATIGASKLSAMAEKLETAAKDKDIAYLKNHIDLFLTDLHTVLEAIRPILPEDPAENSASDGRISGDEACLGKILDCLNDATELASIHMIEAQLNQLREYLWPEWITTELLAIQTYLEVFDYDGILESILHLKQSLNKTESIQ